MKLRKFLAVLLVLCLFTTTMTGTAKAATKLKIISLSDDVVACSYGEKASVSVKAQGDGLKYRWYFKDPGDAAYRKSNDTDNVFTFKLTAAKNGRQAYCVVADRYGNKVKSSVVKFYRLSILQQPSNDSATNGKIASTTVKAAGQSLIYRWYFKDVGDAKYQKANDTDATFSFKMTAAKDGRKAYCQITDKYGNTIKTRTVTFTKPKITAQPKNDYDKSGAVVSTTVKAEGEGLTYQWYFKDVGDTKFRKANDTDNVFSFKMAETKSGRQAYCRITDKYGTTIKTNTVKFHLFGITEQPQHVQKEDYNSYIKMSVTAEGEGLSYQWYYKNIDMSEFKPVSGSDGGQNSSYSYKLVWGTRGRKSYCVVSDRYGHSVKTNTVVGSLLRVITLPTGDCANYGETVTAEAFATGTDITYRWYFKDVGDSSYTKSSVTNGDFSFTMQESRVGRKAYCLIRDSFGNQVKTNVVVFSRLAITQHPVDTAVENSGDTAKLTVKAVGEGLKYQWYEKEIGGKAEKVSCTSATYTCQVTGMKRAYCIVTDKYGNFVESNSALLKIDSGNDRPSEDDEDYDRHDCTKCDGYGNCTNCDGTGYYMKWLPGTREYEKVRCDKAFCSGGRCTFCDGHGNI